MGSLESVAIVATCKSTFAGAGTIKCRFLSRLSALGATTIFVGEGVPPALQRTDESVRVRTVRSGHIRSASPNSLELLQAFLVEALVDECRLQHRTHHRVVLWGSHLFPYGAACVEAKRILMREGISPFLILFPVGSDIWEIGRSVPAQTQFLLTAPEVDALATYSEQFAQEVRFASNAEVQVHVTQPFVLPHQFARANAQSRCRSRSQFGIGGDDIVLINHSNMRPVKRIDFVIELAERVASISSRPVWLILLGPKGPCMSADRKLKVLSFDTATNVETYLQASDIALNASLHDSFNTALLEAMSCGLIPVTSDRPAISRHIETAQAGIVFPTLGSSADVLRQLEGPYPIDADSVDHLAHEIALMSPERARSIRDNGHKLMKSDLSLDSGTRSLCSLLELAL